MKYLIVFWKHYRADGSIKSMALIGPAVVEFYCQINLKIIDTLCSRYMEYLDPVKPFDE